MITVANRLKHVKEYYFSTKLREVRSLAAQGKPIINFAIGSPDLAPPKEVKEALYGADIHGYQNYQGLPELREAMAQFYKRSYDVNLNPTNEILPLMGSKEGIMHISMAFLNPGDQVLIPNPGYPTYASVSNLLEAEIISYDLLASNQWAPDFDTLEKLDLTRVKIMWVNYPHMPTGSNANTATLEKIIAFGKKHQILIVNDNPYSFVLNNNPQSILSIHGAKDTAIELNSLSKSFNMAGWRVGMVTGHQDILKHILTVKSNMDSGMYYGIQQGAIAALNQDKSWFDKINDTYARRRDLVWKICDVMHCTYDKNATGMFIWAKVPQGQKSSDICDTLLYKHNVFIAPGHIFGSNGEGYIRFSLCLGEEQIKTVLKRIEHG